jgi:hypothetical protein
MKREPAADRPTYRVTLRAEPGTDASAVDEVITRAEAGEAMSVSTVKQIVEDAKDADADGKARPRRGGWSRERWRRHKEKKRHQAAERGAILVDVVNQTLQRMDLEILELQTESVATGGDDEMAAHKGKMAEHATVNGTPPAVIKELIAETTTEKAVIKTPAIEIVGELLKDIDPDEIVKVMPTALRDRLRDLALKTLPPWRLVEEFRRRIPSCKPKTTAAADNLWARMNIEGLGP